MPRTRARAAKKTVEPQRDRALMRSLAEDDQKRLGGAAYAGIDASRPRTPWAEADLLPAWVCQYGVPTELYCGRKNVCKRQPASREALEGIEPGDACVGLGPLVGGRAMW